LKPYSIVVVTWNCSAYLRGLVESMNGHLTGAEQLIVVDNASVDDPASEAQRWKGDVAFVGFNENRGFGTASNLGAERAGHDAVIMLNPDTELVDGSLGDLAETALDLDALAGPRILNPDGSVQPSASGSEVGAWPWIRALVPGGLAPTVLVARTEPYRLDRRVRVSWLTGACIAAPRALLKRLGPFDPAIHLYGEDLDLGVRAERAGFASYFCPEACRVIHHGGGSSAQFGGSRDEWRAEGAANRRASLRRAYGARREWMAWRALRLNLRLRVIAKGLLRRETGVARAELRANIAARGDRKLIPPGL
jgi:GT2 family glycosyltransferase